MELSIQERLKDLRVERGPVSYTHLSSSEVMIFPQPGQLLLSSRFVQRRYCLPDGLKILIRAYPQFPHLIFPASHV